MVALDEARLDELYQKALRIDKDIVLEKARLRRLDHDCQQKLKKEDQETRALRESRRVELVECASTIFEWLSELSKSPKGKKILSILEEVFLFRDHYWNCKPREEKEYEAWLICDRNGVLHYREYYKAGILLTSPAQMVNQLHPNYILSVLDAIKTGKVWQNIEKDIRWRAEIFDIRRQRGWWPPKPGQDLVSSY